ncbi:MAG: trehalose-phosphatase [Burkholderiales bacterium]
MTNKTLDRLPCARDREDEIRQRLAGKDLAVFLDYDGTLTPIVDDHAKALLDAETRALVSALSAHCAVTIVSGRDLGRLRELVALDSVWYAGSHGFEIAAPGGSGQCMETGTAFLPQLDSADGALRAQLSGIAGHAVERKRFSIAVHFRQVGDGDRARLGSIVERVIADHRGLRLAHGKMVFELRPDIDWDKGNAVLWLLQRFGASSRSTVPVYIGDDLTDEDAFEALAGRGLCIAVRHDETRQTAADYVLADVAEVKRFLAWLSALAKDAAESA